MLTANGELLSSLVDPNGMEVRYYRNGRIITYTPAQAKFLFETTYQVDWGADPASGIEKKGSFHDVIVPEMVKIFNQSYTLHCNEIKHGGASYDVTWLYNKDFYSIYYAGTEANGHLDWHTWVLGSIMWMTNLTATPCCNSIGNHERNYSLVWVSLTPVRLALF